ncbi:MAG TPA: hypothetical protein VF210_18755 [Pseudomonadales bacterium]
MKKRTSFLGALLFYGVPAALSVGAGIVLALWLHDGAIGARSADPSTSLTASTETPRPDGPAGRTSGHPAATAGAPDERAQLERLQAELEQRLAADPNSALDLLFTLAPAQRALLSSDVIRTAAASAPETTLVWLRDHADAADLETWLAAYAGIAAADPVFALNELLALPEGAVREHGVQRVLEVWSRHDPVAAYEWVRSSTARDAADLHVTVMEGYIDALPQQAGELIGAMPEGPTRARLMDRYAYRVAESNPRAAAEWLARFDDAAPAQQALTTVYDQWAEQNPWAALEHAMQNVDGKLAFELAGRMALELALARPDELARSLERFPEAYRGVAAEQLATVWAVTEPEKARRWVDRLPAGALQQQARRALIESRRG